MWRKLSGICPTKDDGHANWERSIPWLTGDRSYRNRVQDARKSRIVVGDISHVSPSTHWFVVKVSGPASICAWVP